MKRVLIFLQCFSSFRIPHQYFQPPDFLVRFIKGNMFIVVHLSQGFSLKEVKRYVYTRTYVLISVFTRIFQVGFMMQCHIITTGILLTLCLRFDVLPNTYYGLRSHQILLCTFTGAVYDVRDYHPHFSVLRQDIIPFTIAVLCVINIIYVRFFMRRGFDVLEGRC